MQILLQMLEHTGLTNFRQGSLNLMFLIWTMRILLRLSPCGGCENFIWDRSEDFIYIVWDKGGSTQKVMNVIVASISRRYNTTKKKKLVNEHLI